MEQGKGELVILMCAILTWGRDLIIQPAESVQKIHELKHRLGGDREFIIHDSNYLSPIKLDNAIRQLDGDEQVEWLHLEVYPALVEEGQMIRTARRFERAPKVEELRC